MKTILVATIIAFTACVFLGHTTIYAQNNKSCNIDDQLGIIYNEADNAHTKLAEQQIEVLNKIESIAAKCKDKNKPVREQLSYDDNAMLTELIQRRNIIALGSLLESRRMRDIQVLRKFAMLAEKDVRWPEIPAENHPDFIYYVMLASARQAFGDNIETTMLETGSCNLETSIHILEQEAIDKVNAMDSGPLQELQKFTDRMTIKYKAKQLDIYKMSKVDQKTLNELSEKNQPYFRLMTLVHDYEIIKLLAKASHLIYESDRSDIITYGGDIESMGKTIMEKANSGAYGELMKKAHAIMRVINDKIPCDDQKETETMLRKLGKSDQKQ